MKQKVINNIMQGMLGSLNNVQLERLKEVLEHAFFNKQVSEAQEENDSSPANEKLLDGFISAKRIEGCSEKSLTYYRTTIETMTDKVKKNVREIVTDDLRTYLTEYQQEKGSSKVTIDNIRRILSSFFSWLEDEDYILKSPARRRDHCETQRDLALIDMLASTGMRVGELVLLNRDDINFEERECVVFGKGSKERMVYFDARTKIHLQNYIQARTDDNPALFVTLRAPHSRLTICGVESRLRELGKRLEINKVHPHKFRRTLATIAIDKGMPIEQLQRLLGHKRIDTTLQYAMVKQSNVKLAHRKYVG